jgi:hypothetical protein
MTNRLNWEKAKLANKPTSSIVDEYERIERDPATRWLERTEKLAAKDRPAKARRKPKPQDRR